MSVTAAVLPHCRCLDAGLRFANSNVTCSCSNTARLIYAHVDMDQQRASASHSIFERLNCPIEPARRSRAAFCALEVAVYQQTHRARCWSRLS